MCHSGTLRRRRRRRCAGADNTQRSPRECLAAQEYNAAPTRIVLVCHPTPRADDPVSWRAGGTGARVLLTITCKSHIVEVKVEEL